MATSNYNITIVDTPTSGTTVTDNYTGLSTNRERPVNFETAIVRTALQMENND